MDKEVIIKEFELRKFGSKGWLSGKLDCPECGLNDKFGILFNGDSGVCKCMRCSIDMPLKKYLREIGRGDLAKSEESYNPKPELPSLHGEKKQVEEMPETDKPLGFRRISSDTYLNDRGFTHEQYDQFHVGVSNIAPGLKDKLIFLQYNGGKLVGWLARSKRTYEWHKENMRKHKEEGAILVLRYKNSENDFSKILGGLDEITPNTKTVILVEGLFDKANVDRLYQLNTIEEVKCCYTFGSDISDEQCDLIPDTVEHIIMLYDADAISHMKPSGGRLINRFRVEIAVIEDTDEDPGSMGFDMLQSFINKRKNFINFYQQLIKPKWTK